MASTTIFVITGTGLTESQAATMKSDVLTALTNQSGLTLIDSQYSTDL